MSEPDPPPAAPQLGLICRQCGCGHFDTTSTRKLTGGRVMRRRACRHCQKRIVTYERAIG